MISQNNSNISKQSKNVYKPLEIVKKLEVIEPYKPDIIEFENVNDFNEYYNKHTDEFNQTTYKLNVKYKIPGYKLTKKGEQLKIIKDYYKKDASKDDSSLQESFHSSLRELYQRIIELEKQVEHINNYLAQNECYD